MIACKADSDVENPKPEKSNQEEVLTTVKITETASHQDESADSTRIACYKPTLVRYFICNSQAFCHHRLRHDGVSEVCLLLVIYILATSFPNENTETVRTVISCAAVTTMIYNTSCSIPRKMDDDFSDMPISNASEFSFLIIPAVFGETLIDSSGRSSFPVLWDIREDRSLACVNDTELSW